MNEYEIRVDVFSGYRRTETVTADHYEVFEWGVLEFYDDQNNVVATFASGKWVYVKKL